MPLLDKATITKAFNQLIGKRTQPYMNGACHQFLEEIDSEDEYGDEQDRNQ